ncbi:hypothetical protein [Knoellia sinensis]|uniref:hypothetical protein n=1 Tax=Knoellia sinensis TaxID=136100 RepID=UPI0012EC2A6F|nr:hypothetical protein [Knoellia sinensis]
MAVGLIEAALARWEANDWHTYDELEVNCTGQLYRWLQEARRTEERFHVLGIQIEHVVLTPEMMEGLTSVVSAQRPDLYISVQGGGIHVEAKRLLSTGPWCRDYVKKGMSRFVSSSYGAGEALGLMIGYVQQPTGQDLLPRVNDFVKSHPAMGATHQLRGRAHAPRGAWHESTHVRDSDLPINLVHVWLTM